MKTGIGRIGLPPGVKPRSCRSLRNSAFTVMALALTLVFLRAQVKDSTVRYLGTTALVEGAAAGTNSVVLGTDLRSWTATNNATWLHVSAGSQRGTYSAAVIFTFDSNPGDTRVGTLTIAGLTLTITQASSNYVQASGPPTALVSTGLSNPEGVAVDAGGNVYIADANNNAIKEWVAASNTVVTLVSNGLNFPEGVAVDAAGNVYFADSGNNAIKEWVAASNNVITLVSNQLSSPFGVALDQFSNVYFADANNNAIKEWSRAGNTVITLVSNGLSSPQGVAVDAAGDVYIADHGNNAIKMWFADDNTVSTLVSLDTGPEGVAVDGSGNVYFAATANQQIQKWTGVSGTVTTLVSSNLDYPSGVAVDGLGNVYFANFSSGTLLEQPYVFVNTATPSEPGNACFDQFQLVLPSKSNLLPPFSPTSDVPWLLIAGVGNGQATCFFLPNTEGSTRTGHLKAYALLEATSQIVAGQGTNVVTYGSGTNSMNVQISGSGSQLSSMYGYLGAWLAGPNSVFNLTLLPRASQPIYTNVPAVTNWAMEWEPLALSVGSYLQIQTTNANSPSIALGTITMTNTSSNVVVGATFAGATGLAVRLYKSNSLVATNQAQNGGPVFYLWNTDGTFPVRGVELYSNWFTEPFWVPTQMVSFGPSPSATQYPCDGAWIIPEGIPQSTVTNLAISTSQSGLSVITTNISVAPLWLYPIFSNSLLTFNWYGTGILQSSTFLPVADSESQLWSDQSGYYINPTNYVVDPTNSMVYPTPSNFYRIRQPLGDAPGF